MGQPSLAKPGPRRSQFILAAMGVITVVFVAISYYWLTRKPSASEAFWGPVLRDPLPASVVLAEPCDAARAIAMARIASHLARLGRTPVLSASSDPPPEKGPVILIGGAGEPQSDASVTRLFDRASPHPRITLSGDAALASAFLTTRPWLEDAFRAAPPGWEQKNLRLTLRGEGSPPTPKVVSLDVW